MVSRGIRVNTLSPGPVDPPIVDTNSPTPEAAAVFREYAASTVPMKRMGRPDEVAAGALFLASDESSLSTGMELRVDGGHAELEANPRFAPERPLLILERPALGSPRRRRWERTRQGRP